METKGNSRGMTPRVKTLAAALSVALAGGLAGAFGVADAASHPPTHQGAANKSTWVSHAKQHAPKYDKLLAQFAAFAHSARPAPSRAPMTRVISSRSDSGSGSLRGALTDAVDGDIIDLRNVHGTISLSDVLQTTANVEIRGPGRDQLTIDGGGKNRVFSASHGLRLSNVTIANGAAPRAAVTNGGCLYAAGELYLNNVTLSGCTAGDATSPAAVGGAVSVQGALLLYNSTISNSTATGYTYAAGGGAFVIGGDQSGSYTALYNSTVSGNSATVVEGPYSYLATGGGLQVVGSTGTTPYASYAPITKSIITGNHATVQATYNNNSYPLVAQGGGAYIQGGVESLITGSTVEYNTMYSYYFALGAGVASSGPMTISNSKVLKNSGTAGFIAYGGGVFAFAPVTVDRSSIQNNTVDGFISVGGGLDSEATTSLTNSVVSGNAAGITTAVYSNGGGVSRKYNKNVGHASTTITNSTISGNTAAPVVADGGGVFEAEALTMNNSTVAFNTSTYGGGVTTTSSATIALFSTIISNNTAPGGSSSADLYAYGGPITATGDHNLIIASDSGVTLPGDTLTDDPLLQPLAMNGGPTMTHALDPASPAVDTGSNPLTLSFDQRGSPYARVVGAAADIGAYELDTDHIFGNGFE